VYDFNFSLFLQLILSLFLSTSYNNIELNILFINIIICANTHKQKRQKIRKQGEKKMEYIYNSENSNYGYLNGNTIYDNYGNSLGYISNNIIYDNYYNIAGYLEGDVVYNAYGTVVGYTDGYTVLDTNYAPVGRVNSTFFGLVAAAGLLLLLGGMSGFGYPGMYGGFRGIGGFGGYPGMYGGFGYPMW
jgi:hypothetical protein